MNNEGLPLLVQGAVHFNPLGSTNLIAFMVMFLSNLCAPGFLFIAGYVLALSIQKRKLKGISNSEINRYLWQRGIWLILFELFIASPAFNLPLFIQTKSLSALTIGTFFSFSVLSTIGIGFFVLAVGRHISPLKLLGLSGALYLLSQWFLPSLTENFPFQTTLVQSWQAILLLPVPFSSKLLMNNNFPVIPWLLPMTLGWLYGNTFAKQRGTAYEARRFAVSGICSLILFFIFRFAGIGDYLLPNGTFQGFFGLSKYPPSPNYFLLYIGLIFLLLFAFYRLPQISKIGKVLEAFGRVPLLFYLTHLWLYAAVPAVLATFNGHSLSFGVVIWLIGLLILYPLCHWYSIKSSTSK